MTKKVKILEDHVINKIAAGEVIENSASVLKELVENSIDAQATRIDIDIHKAGLKLIRIADDGEGMSREDALLAIERHATSKLHTDRDLYTLTTMGFRGEALPSIASVSHFTVRTAQRDNLIGTRIRIDGGKVQDVSDDTIAPGTIIEVANLFFNVPARKKFVRSFHAEKMSISQIFLKIAFAYPDIAFVLKDDNKELYHLLRAPKIRDRISNVFGKDFVADLIPFSYQSPDLSVYGYVSHPQLCRNTRSGQYLYVNKRPIVCYQVSQAIQKAYGSLLPHGRFPICFVFIDIDPAQVDVNVHPTKKEVKFSETQKIQEIVQQSVGEVLKKSKLVFDIKEQSEELKKINLSYNIPRFKTVPNTDESSSQPIQPGQESSIDKAHPKSAPKQEPEETDDVFIKHLEDIISMDDEDSQTGEQTAFETSMPIETEDQNTQHFDCEDEHYHELQLPPDPGKISGIRVVGQIGKLFILGENKEGLVVIDQHAAHERINYERILYAMLNNEHISQTQLFPITYKCDKIRKKLILGKLDLLQQAGIGISDFGPDTLIIDSLPIFINPGSIIAVLEDLAEEIQNGPSSSIENWQIKLAALMACKASVKAADSLTLEEMQNLVDDLHKTDTPYTCPHGRPTILKMEYGKLRRHFQRE